MSMYFDSCVRDQTLIVLFTIAFASGTLLTAILIVCLNRQCRRIVQWLFFQRRAVVCEFVGQLNSSQDSQMSPPSKQIKYMHDLFELNDESVKHIDLKDLVEENQRKDPGLPPFGFEENSKGDEKDGGKTVEQIDVKTRLVDKPVGPNYGETKWMNFEGKRVDVQVRPSEIETRRPETETKRTHEAESTSKLRAESNVAEGQKEKQKSDKTFPKFSVSKVDGPRIKILSKFPEIKLKLRPAARQSAVDLKIKKR